MVIRGFGSCATCDHRYILRAGVGIESYQLHYVDCSECETPIVLAVRAKPPNARFEVEENFRLGTHEDEHATLINLHPNFAFDPEDFHDRISFPSLKYVARIAPHVEHLVVPGQKFVDTAFLFDVPNMSHVWGLVRRGLNLEGLANNGKPLNRTLEGYLAARRRFRPDTVAEDVGSMLSGFLRAAFFPQVETILVPALQLRNRAEDEFPDQFQEFLNYYRSQLAAEQKHRFVSIFSDYFKHFAQYSQMLVHARLGDTEPEAKVVGSKAFEEIKLYYGQAYETLTTSFVILACINNILLGRNYDRFQSMTLNKYMKDVEKAKRANPFNNEPGLYAFSQGLDSALRNGSHHASIWRDGDVVYFRSGGSGAERNLPFSTYLHLCNVLTIELAAIWLLDRSLVDG